MLKDEPLNTLFHRCVNKENEYRSIKEVYKTPIAIPRYQTNSYENPLRGCFILNNESITFGSYDNKAIEWSILDYDAYYSSYVLITKEILFNYKFDDPTSSFNQTNRWEDCSLRKYLNDAEDSTSFYNIAFTSKEKSYIKEVVTQSGISDYIFILGSEGGYQSTVKYNYEDYFSLSTNTKRIGEYINIPSEWWLRSPGYNTQLATYVKSTGEVDDLYGKGVGSSLGIRPVIVVSIDAFEKTNSIINPLYSERVSTYKEDVTILNNNLTSYMTISEQVSTHNARLQEKIDIDYDKIKNDFSIFKKEVSGYSYNYITKNETFSVNILQDGIYLTFHNIFIVMSGIIYGCGTLQNNSIETLFLEKLEIVSVNKLPDCTVYASCWADLNPYLELYLPHEESINTIFWLGDRYSKKEYPEIYDLINPLLNKNESLYI